LDNIQKKEFPKELKEFLEQSIGQPDEANMKRFDLSAIDAINNTDKYEENKEAIEKYLEYINSDEYEKLTGI